MFQCYSAFAGGWREVTQANLSVIEENIKKAGGILKHCAILVYPEQFESEDAVRAYNELSPDNIRQFDWEAVTFQAVDGNHRVIKFREMGEKTVQALFCRF